VASRVDVVVVSYNSVDWLRGCVEPLAGDPRIGVVVVDNASRDESVADVADLPIDLVPLDENVGFGSGCNVGWQRGDAPYVLFLNPDTAIDPERVLALADALERAGAGAVAPRIVGRRGELEWSLRRFPQVRSIFAQALFLHRLFTEASWADEVIRDPARYEHEAPCDWASGACLLVRRDLLTKIGGFDEGFFLYREDVDLCRRIWNADRAVVYTPAVECMHVGGASAPRWRLLGVLASSRIRYARKHFGRARAAAYHAGVAINAASHFVAGRGLTRRLGHLIALLAAFGLELQI
jgi:GT2 family glycosyltransferase